MGEDTRLSDWHPQLILRIDPGNHELTGDLDTGSPLTFLSFEWLLSAGLVKEPTPFTYFEAGGDSFQALSVRLEVSAVSGAVVSPTKTCKVLAVRRFSESPFTKQNRDRFALIGRDILQQLAIAVEINASQRTVAFSFVDWKTFEEEVAARYRRLGLKAQRNYDLAGSQVDILLTEETASGKSLRTIVECKYHKRPVGRQYVQELAALHQFAKDAGLADHALIVATGGFTKSARAAARAAGIELLEFDELRARSEGLEEPATKETAEEEPQKNGPRVAFVIMPFDDTYRDTYVLGYREILAAHGFTCTRADEVEFNGRIMDQVLDLIRSADIVVAEVSEPNPNVYYELGVSHALNKTVILCTKEMEHVPFDTRDLNHIVYRDTVELREKLARRLASLIVVQER